MDKETYSDLISETCSICYHFNGEYFSCNKDVYVSKLVKGYFENTTKVKVIIININKKGEFYETDEVCHFTRNGSGKDEVGAGVYEMRSRGIMKVFNSKIIHIQYTFNKIKIKI